ncbi:MAG TPA: dephospho-CoA kinase [Candidatus Krumholzibacterium sp.]|nr:dephospho-CoA kinase [Candidatus Krumholzibacterium sp.]
MDACPVIVVTGPIASGKTTVAGIIAGSDGAHLVADKLAHRALKEERLTSALRMEFGDGIFGVDGAVAHSALSRIVFGDAGAMARLNAIVRPAVTGIIEEEVGIKCRTAPYIVLDAVLYFEYKFRFKAGMVVLVDAPPEIRLQRLMERDGITEEEARRRIAGQGYLESGWAGADVTIDTSAGLEAVRRESAIVRDRFIREYVL